MIVEIDEYNKVEHAQLLDEIHLLRHRVFVEQLHWDGVESIDGREYDEFDTSDATYFASLDEQGNLIATIRLHRYSCPTLMAKVFPHLVQFMPIPIRHDFADLSRFVVSPDIGKDRLATAGWDLMRAVADMARRENIKATTCVGTTYFMKNAQQFRMDVRPLGFPIGEGRERYLAMMVTVPAVERIGVLPDPREIIGFELPVAAA